MIHEIKQFHRTDSLYSYKGIPIHTTLGMHERAAAEINEAMPHKGRVLELGAGSGAFSRRLADMGYEVLASDINPAGFNGGTKFVEADLNKNFSQHFMGMHFDTIVALETIEHLENPHHFFREVGKLLAEKTILWLSFPNIHVYSAVLAFVRSGELANWSRDQYWRTGHQTILPDWLVEEHCAKHGLVVEKKVFCAPVDFRLHYPNLVKRFLAKSFVDTLCLLSRDIPYEVRVADNILLKIRKEILEQAC